MPAGKGKQQLYTLLAIGKAQLHMSEDDYRAMLKRHGARPDSQRKYSATSMSIGQLISALDDLKTQGFVPTGAARRRTEDWRTRRINKITALWCTLADAGVVHERGYQSMERWCRTLIKTPKLEWANGVALNNCIEALKSWSKREGVNTE